MISVDTNILSRLVQPAHAHHSLALSALNTLHARGELLCLVPQVLYEFWTVCTRPRGENGLGLTSLAASNELVQAKSLFPILGDTPALYAAWEHLVVQYDVKGKNAHDARIVAAMQVHGVSHLLTFNARDFARYPDITVLFPEQL